MDNEYISTLLPEEIPGLDGIGALVAMLDLEDNEFESMKPLLLEELEKGFNNSNDKYNLAFAMNMSGRSVAELRTTFEEVIQTKEHTIRTYHSKDGSKKVLISGKNEFISKHINKSGELTCYHDMNLEKFYDSKGNEISFEEYANLSKTN